MKFLQNLYVLFFAVSMSFSNLQDTEHKKLDELLKLLANDDPQVRDKAQNELEKLIDDEKIVLLKKQITKLEPEVKWRVEAVITSYERKKSGKIVFERTDSLWIMNFDGSDEELLTSKKGSTYGLVFNHDGSKVAYLFSTGGGKNQIHIINLADKSEKQLTDSNGIKSSLCFTPDSKHIVFVAEDQISIIDIDGKETKKLTTVGKNHRVVISTITKKIFFVSEKSGLHEIYSMDLDGKNQKKITDSKRPKASLVCSSDGKKLAYVSYDSKANISEIYTLNTDGTNEEQITNSKFAHREGLAFTRENKFIICSSITIFS